MSAWEIACKITDEFQVDEPSLLRQAIEAAILAEREACAKIADQSVVDFLSPQYATNQPHSSFGERFACKQIAEQIRSTNR